jgi:N,N-dimethylformamidase
MARELPKKRIVGYADKISAAPGSAIRFMVSCEEIETYRADIVRLVSGDLHPEGSGLIEELVETPAGGDYPGRPQSIHAGSHAVIEIQAPFAELESFTLQAMIWPTAPGKGRQVVMGKWSEAEAKGFALILDETGALALLLGDGEAEILGSGTPLLEREWAFVAASFDTTTRTARLWQEAQADYPRTELRAEAEASVELTRPGSNNAPFMIAACQAAMEEGRPVAGGHFNGKIDSPRVARGALNRAEIEKIRAAADPLPVPVVAAWDFSREMTTDRIVDLGPSHLDGRLVNLPTRAMKGHNWTGAEMNWTHAPGQYGAIHFHDDDIYDCGWETDFTLEVPEGLASGIYAARLDSGDEVDHIPFVVRPGPGAPTADAVFLMPSASYMAYANEHAGSEGGGYLQVLGNHLTALSAQAMTTTATAAGSAPARASGRCSTSAPGSPARGSARRAARLGSSTPTCR